MLGAAIVLPDHPQIAPESRGNLFDNTEIEEALLLHVQALSDGERAEIEEQDPAVREMIERARPSRPRSSMRLHGRVELRDPVTREPPRPSADRARPHARAARGRRSTGSRSGAAASVVLRPGLEARPAGAHARGPHGHGRAHLPRLRRPGPPGRDASTTPGQELMRETGRFLYFFPAEVEVVRSEADPGRRDRQRLAAATTASAARWPSGWSSASCPRGRSCSTSAPAGSTSPTRSCAATTRCVLVDVSRQGGEPGTLYVMEADEEEVDAGIEDGQVINPHGMDPQTVLRFVKTRGRAGPARSWSWPASPPWSRRWASG